MVFSFFRKQAQKMPERPAARPRSPDWPESAAPASQPPESPPPEETPAAPPPLPPAVGVPAATWLPGRVTAVWQNGDPPELSAEADGRTRIHFDEVRGLGRFIELEVVLRPGEDRAAGRREAAALMKALGIRRADLLAGAYADLL